MSQGYVTLDNVDFNEIWYGSTVPAVDLYRTVDLPALESLALDWPEQVLKYWISEKNGFQLLGPGQRPNRRFVEEGTLYPIVKKYGYGIGSDLDTLRRSPARAFRNSLDRGFKEDRENVFLQMLKVMMTDPGTNNADHGWYNGQFSTEEKVTTPPKFQNNTFAASHNHYYTTAAATITLAKITAAKQTIRHHGHNGPLAAFINSAERQALEDLAAFTGNIIRSPVSDEVAVKGFGDVFELVGVTWHVTEMIPAGYILIVEVNQPEEARPVAMFRPDNIQGLNLMPGPMNDYPLVESFFERWFGVRVLQRGAGVAVQITTNANYTNPTFNE